MGLVGAGEGGQDFPRGSAVCLQCRRPWFDPWVGKIPWRRDRPPTLVFLGFLDSSVSKQSACNVGDLGLIPGLERSPGGRHSNPFQYSCLENPYGQTSLVGCSLWGHKELDTTEQLSLSLQETYKGNFVWYSISMYNISSCNLIN